MSVGWMCNLAALIYQIYPESLSTLASYKYLPPCSFLRMIQSDYESPVAYGEFGQPRQVSPEKQETQMSGWKFLLISGNVQSQNSSTHSPFFSHISPASFKLRKSIICLLLSDISNCRLDLISFATLATDKNLAFLSLSGLTEADSGQICESRWEGEVR